MGKTVTNLSFRPLQQQVVRAMQSAGIKEDWELVDNLDHPYAATPPKEAKVHIFIQFYSNFTFETCF